MPKETDNPFSKYLEQAGSEPPNPFAKYVVPPPEAEPSYLAKDMGTQLGVGVAKSIPYIYGMPGDIQDLLYSGVEAAGGPPKDMIKSLMGQHATSAETLAGIEKNITGPLPEAKTVPGKYTEKAGEYLLPALAGPGSVARKVLQYDVAPAIASEFGRQKFEGTPYETPAAVAGALLAPGISRRVATPFPAAPARTQAANYLRDVEGMTGDYAPSAGQRTGSRGLRYAESLLEDIPFAPERARNVREGAQAGFTRAALRRAGIDSDRANPEVMDQAFTRIGNQFNALSARNTMHLDPQVQNDLLNHVADYQFNVNPSMRSPAPENVMNSVAGWAGGQGGHLTGRQYQTTRSQLGAAARGATDPYLSRVLSEMTESLDEAMERSIAANNPGDAGAFGEARRQYRNLLPLEKAMTGAGEDVAAGYISPAKLRQAVVSTQGARAYVRGQGDFSDLVHAGNEVLTPLPNSGTAQRMHVSNALTALVGGPAAGLGYLLGGDVPHAEASGLLGAFVGAPALKAVGESVGLPLIAKGVYSRPGQWWLNNQMAPRMAGVGQEESAARLAMARALAEGFKPKSAPQDLNPQ